jgi:hypothetical protein
MFADQDEWFLFCCRRQRQSTTVPACRPLPLEVMSSLSYAQSVERQTSWLRGRNVISGLGADRRRISLLPAPGHHPGGMRVGIPTAWAPSYR